MKQCLPVRPCFLLFLTVLFVACSTPLILTNWKDPDYNAKPLKIMVVSIDGNQLTRVYFEERFAARIKKAGTEAIASFTVLNSREQNDPEAIMNQIKEQGADALLVTRLLRKEMAQTQKGASSRPKLEDYLGYDKQSLYPPGVIAEDGFAVIETRLYDSRIKLIWTATSRSALGGAFQQRIESYIDTMIQAMSEQDLLHG